MGGTEPTERPPGRRSHRALAVVALVVVLATLAACSSGGSGKASGPTSTTTTGPTGATAAATGASAVPRGASYVALGSSFAAGPGIPAQEADCGRSDHNYPSLVAATLSLALVDESCSGATTANILDTPQGARPPQIDAVTAATRLVTVTVGGNDIGYSAAAIACGGASPSAHCTQQFRTARTAGDIAALPARLDAVLRAISRRAPRAVVVVVTYARVVPAGAPCPLLDLAPADARYVQSLGATLERDLVAAAGRGHARIADPYVRAAGHGPCATAAARWVEGFRPRSAGYPFHPNANGHLEMARLVTAAVRSA